MERGREGSKLGRRLEDLRCRGLAQGGGSPREDIQRGWHLPVERPPRVTDALPHRFCMQKCVSLVPGVTLDLIEK